MPRLTLTGSLCRHAATLTLIGSAAILSGCAGMPYQQNNVIGRDILEIKQKLDQNIERQNQMTSKMDYTMNSVTENVGGKTDALQTAVDENTKSVRQLMQEVSDLRKQVGELSMKIPVNPGGTPGINPGVPGGTGTGTGTGSTQIPPASTFAEAFANAKQAYDAGNYEAAREGFNMALGMNPSPREKGDAQYMLGESLYKLNNYAAAETQLWALVQENASHPQAWASVERLGDTKLKQGQPDKAITFYQTIITKYPQYPNLAAVKGKLRDAQAELESKAQPIQ